MKKPPQQSTINRAIGGKTAVWLPESNRYVLAVPPADEAVELIAAGWGSKAIGDFCVANLGFPQEQAVQLECEARKLISGTAEAGPEAEHPSAQKLFGKHTEATLFSEKFYSLFGCVFRVGFSTAKAEFAVHPKFAHLEIHPQPSPHHHFLVGHRHGYYSLRVDGAQVGVWPEARECSFSGKFSLQLLGKALRKKDGDWMAVVHAACISKGKNCLLFAGGSGTGKSMLSALLLARGFDVLADDCLPLESETGQACRFPAAISVKKDAFHLLSPTFPALKKAQAYHYPQTGKTVRYLPIGQNNEKTPRKATCRGLVFVEYRPGSILGLENMPPEDAFARLVPDAWIQPSAENARRFLKWFAHLPCYQLTYSDNDKMIATIKTLFAKTAV